MNREPLNGEVIKTDDGQYIRYNAQIGCYELLELQSTLQPRSQPPDSGTNEVEIMDNDISSGDISSVEDISAEDTSVTDMFPKRRLWDLTTTLLMLDECTTHKKELADPKMRNTAVYKKISMKMKEHGYNFTPEQIQNRMKTLISKYKEIRDHNAGSGNSFKDWEYYELMENYMGRAPNITPVASCSSLGNNIINAINAKKIIKEKNCDTDKISSSTVPSLQSSSKSNVMVDRSAGSSETQKKTKRIRSSPRVEMLAFLKEYKEDVRRRELERMRIMKEQHQETKEMVSELISILRKSKEKE
ncbi:unnamed protein product [Phaedon cochleariae]|uniref:Myb/SANT-like DNA-binding domain-containing protein n=1 Tax=Phaedon cochleariae TaxID=80249 RepID=A0A9N9SF22_PHACE|nr:unnamed protein product [Phaedon cochleariae]